MMGRPDFTQKAWELVLWDPQRAVLDCLDDA
jgi:hypothetical protein